MDRRLSEYFSSSGIPIENILGTGNDAIIHYKAEASQDQIAQAATLLAAYDWSDTAQQVWEYEKLKQQSLSDLFYLNTSMGVALRAIIRDIYTAINDCRQAQNLPRVAEAEILTRLQNEIVGGMGDPESLSADPVIDAG